MEVLFLGTSSALSLPRKDGCNQCKSLDKRDKRLRTATLINRSILIDAGPDIQDELIQNNVKLSTIKALFLTHEHEDACGGLSLLVDTKIPIYRPISAIQSYDELTIESFPVPHSKVIKTVGFKINELIYISDISDIKSAKNMLEAGKWAILDGSGWDKVFPSHDIMKDIITFIKPMTNLEKVYFTHIGHSRIPHDELEFRTKALGGSRMDIAYDGLKIILN